MCGQKYCLHNGVLTVVAGESVITTSLHGRHTGFLNPDPQAPKGPNAQAYRHVPDGSTIVLCDVPLQIQSQYNVKPIETVRFIEITKEPFDLVKFDSVEKPVPLRQFGFGVRFDILTVPAATALPPDPPKQRIKTANRARRAVTFAVQSFLALFAFLR